MPGRNGVPGRSPGVGPPGPDGFPGPQGATGEPGLELHFFNPLFKDFFKFSGFLIFFRLF